MNVDRYYDSLEQKYYYDLEKVDREDYDELLNKYSKLKLAFLDLKTGHEYFVEQIKELIRKDNMHDLAEFLVSEDIYL